AMRMVQYVNQWLSRQLPGYCAFCLSADCGEQGWCAQCFRELPWNTPACPQCAEPLPAGGGGRCGHCLVAPPAFTHTTAALRYLEGVAELVHDFKFHGSARAGTLLVELMLCKPPVQLGGALLPVPMHPSRARERGFNQAQWLARQLGKRLQLPVLEAECHKRLPSQRSLNRAERQRNLAGAYRVAGPLPEWVIIIDDVVTTGATGHALALAAQAAGATRVDVWAASRTPLEKS
ncbi:ComF family protein, partial [Vreelandella stevensii]|uniref:ComF family protein n=2 Tax=Halomonadaceae TaxID=28256 RepID=UPI003078D32B